MSELNLEFFKKLPSEELLLQAKECIAEFNPNLLDEFSETYEEDY